MTCAFIIRDQVEGELTDPEAIERYWSETPKDRRYTVSTLREAKEAVCE